MTNEQIEIDKLVYKMYNLNDEDIKEVENWYFRRYPKLAEVIENKLKEWTRWKFSQNIEKHPSQKILLAIRKYV